MMTNEPTWFRLAQGLLLSPPSLYGDCLATGYLRVGVRAMRAFILSLGVRNCYTIWSRLLFWSTSQLGRTQPCSPLELCWWPGYVLVL